MVSPKFLLHTEASKQHPCEPKIISMILKMVERDGYENCLSYKKKGGGFNTLNKHFHADDGPLSNYIKRRIIIRS